MYILNFTDECEVVGIIVGICQIADITRNE